MCDPYTQKAAACFRPPCLAAGHVRSLHAERSPSCNVCGIRRDRFNYHRRPFAVPLRLLSPDRKENELNTNITACSLYLAGGCFWGVEALFRRMPGVFDTCVGYANGRQNITEAEARYETVCTGTTGLHECCRVSFNAMKTSSDALLYAFFRIIDPTLTDQQGNDIGSQYQAAAFWPPEDRQLEADVLRVFSIERARCEKAHGAGSFRVQAQPLREFFPAEQYHQDYLVKNPGGYCHVPLSVIRRLSTEAFDPRTYRRSNG